MADKKVLFQGQGYRVLEFNDLNVVLETQKEDGSYKFQGYYTDIQKALHSLVRRDMLIDRSHKLEAKSYLSELDKVKEQMINDIDKHFNTTVTSGSDLTLDDLLQ